MAILSTDRLGHTIKAGDCVRATQSCSGAYMGGEYVVFEDKGLLCILEGGARAYASNGVACTCTSTWELITKKENIKMGSIIEKIKIAAKSEPDKSAIKAGIRTTSDDFTSEGKEAFLEYLYQKNKTDFDTVVVQPILTEAKEA